MFKYKIHNIKTDCNKKNEENSLVKINSFPIIKDEEKSFFYKCACLYKTEEYKNKNIFTKLFIIFIYEENYIYYLTIFCSGSFFFLLYMISFTSFFEKISMILSLLIFSDPFFRLFLSEFDKYLGIYEFYNNGLNKKDYIDWINQDKYNLTEYINNKK